MPGLDPKVEQAIRAAAPFSADRARRFTMSYGLRYSKQVAPAQSPAQSTQEQPAQEPTAEPEPPAAE